MEPRRVESIAGQLAESLATEGARAVALVGSFARGDALEGSDLDLAVVGQGPQYRLEVHDDVLVSLGWASAEEQRRRLYDPAILGLHVPGWREAVPLFDPEGLAAALQQEARSWTWGRVEDDCDAWAAERLCGYAEEVQKLVTGLHRGEETAAGVQRSLIAQGLARILAVHRRILYGSENRLWDVVAVEMGASWRDAQAAALGLGGESLAVGCEAALRLFTLAAEELRHLLDDRQHAVVLRALRRLPA
jgi:predicted nucleotidyltransferase